MLVRPRSLVAVLAVALAGPATALAATRLGEPAARDAIRARLHQEYAAGHEPRLRRCERQAPDTVDCVARVRLTGASGHRYRCHKVYRARGTARGVAVTESRDGRRFSVFAPARCRPAD